MFVSEYQDYVLVGGRVWRSFYVLDVTDIPCDIHARFFI